MNESKNEKLFDLIFKNPDEEALIDYLANSPRCSEEGINPFGEQNICEVFWRLARCSVFTEDARAKFERMSGIAGHAVDIEVESDFDTKQKIKSSLQALTR